MLRAQAAAPRVTESVIAEGKRDRSIDAATDAALEATVARLEQQLRDLNARCSTLQATLDHVRHTGSGAELPVPADVTASLHAAASASRVSHLVQVAQSLSTTLRSITNDRSSSSEGDFVAPHTSEDALVAQVRQLVSIDGARGSSDHAHTDCLDHIGP